MPSGPPGGSPRRHAGGRSGEHGPAGARLRADTAESWDTGQRWTAARGGGAAGRARAAELDEQRWWCAPRRATRGAFEALARRHQAALYRLAVRVIGRPRRGRGRAAGGAARRLAAARTGSAATPRSPPGCTASSPTAAWRRCAAGARSRVERGRRRWPRPTPPSGPPSSTPGWPRWAGAVADLPDELRVCWVLRELEGLGYAEIAQITGPGEDAVRGRIHRARVRLAEVMRPWR